MDVESAEEVHRPSQGRGIPWSAEVSDAEADPGEVGEAVRVPAPPAPLVPLTISDLLDGAYNVVKRRPARVLGAVAVFVIPIRLVAAYAFRRTTSDLTASNVINDVGGIGALGDLETADLVLALAAYLLSSLSLFFIGGVVASFVVAWHEGIDLTTGTAVRMVLRRGWAFVVAWALLWPVKAVSTVMLLFPVVFVSALLCLVAPVILIEQAGPIAGIKRAVSLAWRRYFVVLWVVVLATTVAALGSIMLSRIPVFLADLAPSPFDWIGSAVALAASEIVTATALAATMVLLYFDIRVRTEGFDLAHRRVAAFRGRR